MVSYWAQQLLNGIQLGSVYALIALGYTMVYGIIGLINFAHADIFMVGAYLAFFALAFIGAASAAPLAMVSVWIALVAGYLLFGNLVARVPGIARLVRRLDEGAARARDWKAALGVRTMTALVFLVGIMVCSAAVYPVLYFATRGIFSIAWGWLLLPVTALYSMVLCALLGVAMERIAYRPLRNQPRLSALITALGVSLFLENFCSLPQVFDNKYRPFPELIRKADLVVIDALGVSITSVFVVNVTVTAVLLAGLWLLVEKTLLGKQMRAVAFDKKAAALMGINIDRIIAVTFAIGPALAGVSGVLYAANYGILQSPFFGFNPGMKAFIAAVLGGIGSLPGAVIGALIMGVSEVVANSIDSNLGLAIAFLILIVILLFRPNGIMGKQHTEKV